MNKKNKIFFEFSYNKLIISAIDINLEQIYLKEINTSNLKNNLVNKIKDEIRNNIINIEKIVDEFVNDVYVILGLSKSVNIKFTVFKKKENQNVTNADIKYLVQDARQEIIRNNKDLSILHILIENYYVDKKLVEKKIDNFNAKDISIDLNFVCYSSEEISDFRDLFTDNNLLVNKFICYDYLNSLKIEQKLKIHDHVLALKTILGENEKEVFTIPKTLKKKGFFEKLFHYLSK